MSEQTATSKILDEMQEQRFRQQIDLMTDRERDCFYMGLNCANQQWAEKFSKALSDIAPTLQFRKD